MEFIRISTIVVIGISLVFGVVWLGPSTLVTREQHEGIGTFICITTKEARTFEDTEDCRPWEQDETVD